MTGPDNAGPRIKDSGLDGVKRWCAERRKLEWNAIDQWQVGGVLEYVVVSRRFAIVGVRWHGRDEQVISIEASFLEHPGVRNADLDAFFVMRLRIAGVVRGNGKVDVSVIRCRFLLRGAVRVHMQPGGLQEEDRQAQQ